MGARACSRIVVLASLTVGGLCLTVPASTLTDGIGVAEARSYSRRGGYRHRGSRRVSYRVRRRDGSDATVLAALPPERPGLFDDPSLDGADEGRLGTLRAALQNKASALANPLAPAADPAPPAAKSVSFDFEAGLKTTLFEGGVEVREPFDVAAARRLAAPPPAPPRPPVPSS